ncbi:MAG: N-acetylglucosamine-specific PTS transporter subunit IIBC [Lachnospiraceae bacterium]
MMKTFQKLGKALMLPVATLPLAGLLLGIGYAIDPSGWGANNIVAAFMVKGGASILDNQGILFAIGLGFGMTDDNDGTGALAALVSFLMMITLLAAGTVPMFAALLGMELSEIDLAAFAKVGNGNVFFGILAGIIGAMCYNKFKSVKLPAALSFFSGKRCVAIVTGGITMLVSCLLYFVWPLLYGVLVSIGEGVSATGIWGAGVYGFLNRLLIPTGLHHALNNVFWFDLIGINDLGKFWTIPEATGDVGLYMSGFFPVMMFGLPAAGLAIYHTAKKEKKAMVGSLMLAAGVCTFVTGATEPLEFAFMFVAPVLYLIHALLTGVSCIVVGALGVRAGFNFSAGAIDLFLSTNSPHANNPFLLIPIGLVFGVIYYVIFRFMIVKFDLKTPGREKEEDETLVTLASDDFVGIAEKVLEGLGGPSNITSIDHCVTRLRIEVADQALVNEKIIKSAGVAGIIRPSKTSVQVVVGTQVQFVFDELKKIYRK